MENIDKYKKIFSDCLEIEPTNFDDIDKDNTLVWDSLGHMSLIAELEEEFGINFQMEDIIEFNSFKKGIKILIKYGIEFK